MKFITKLKGITLVKDIIISKKYGNNIHDLGLDESIESGIEKKLLLARELGVPYCVVFGGVIPIEKSWDRYGNGEWNPPRDYIGTEDIATFENDRELERQNIYAFLRGDTIVRGQSKEEARQR